MDKSEPRPEMLLCPFEALRSDHATVNKNHENPDKIKVELLNDSPWPLYCKDQSVRRF